jgi:hypothetical protein
MDFIEVKNLSRLGRSVWTNSEDWERSTLEVLTAVSLLDLAEETRTERAAQLLLDRARGSDSSRGNTQNRDLWMNPFYRLNVDQRFVLAALHQAGWSYSRLSRVLGLSVGDIEKIAWNARIQLTIPAVFPAFLGFRGASCPSYDPCRPWTQRFLDEEIQSKRDVLFLQNHLMSCDSCRRTLEKSRELYYEAEKKVPAGMEGDSIAQSLDRIFAYNPKRRISLLEEFFRGAWAFLGRWDILLICFLSAWAFFGLKKH